MAALRDGISPRFTGEQLDHVRALAEAETELPPILVHRPTMLVIDGMHRLRAAQLLGAATIRVRFFDGTDDAAFVLAVKANIAHGLPLSRAEREAAAARILRNHPEWSNRAVAVVTGLAASTVGALRRRQADPGRDQNFRRGRDGRVRPLSTAEGRRTAGEIIARHPDASLREVARAAGISTGTVRDVRARLGRGEDPVPMAQPRVRIPAADGNNGGHDRVDGRRTTFRRRRDPTREPAEILRSLRTDPSLRMTAQGRSLLRWLDARLMGQDRWEPVLDGLPAHCAYPVAELARSCAREWLRFADRLEALTDTAAD
ncbi:ParB/RepB/Spo0J family partition protein [Virgisporangium aurantiacum]|uniref:ParB/RepB/Spo0J family partition protein n=1 Tax=Virgisporangium aurantiacum TaxID=175570 RepID=UPI001950AB07|nr:ParB/RepB/Spo0J family partition protein [Virgisporangium aurantiacum]